MLKLKAEIQSLNYPFHSLVRQLVLAMSGLLRCLFLLSVLFASNALVIPKSDGPSKRVHETVLSDEQHYDDEDFHNLDYDHEAFLGEKEAKNFSDLSPEESQRRLGLIVDKIDTDKDNFVSLQELKEWIQHTQKRYILEDSERQWRAFNPNDETELTWQTYKKSSYGFMDEEEDTDIYNYKELIERDLRRWERADQDNSGSLTKEEFVDFVHPEESIGMRDIVVIETMEDIDKNRDGKISIDEYIGDMYNDDDKDVVGEPSWVTSEREQFVEYRDKDKNGFLDFQEVRQWILPDDYDNSEAEAKHLIYESDVDRDNQLSKEEILNKFDLFVGSQATEFGDALTRHDEF